MSGGYRKGDRVTIADHIAMKIRVGKIVDIDPDPRLMFTYLILCDDDPWQCPMWVKPTEIIGYAQEETGERLSGTGVRPRR